MANLRIAQPLLLSGPIQNSFESLKFWLKFLSDLAKGGVAPSLPGCATAYTMVPRAYERGVQVKSSQVKFILPNVKSTQEGISEKTIRSSARTQGARKSSGVRVKFWCRTQWRIYWTEF